MFLNRDFIHKFTIFMTHNFIYNNLQEIAIISNDAKQSITLMILTKLYLDWLFSYVKVEESFLFIVQNIRGMRMWRGRILVDDKSQRQ